MDDPTLIDDLPKAELHVHLEGTIEPDDMIALADRNGMPLPWTDAPAVAQAYSYTGLADFLQLYWLGCTLVRTAQDVHDLALNYLVRAAAENVRRAEVFFSPQNFLDRIELGEQLRALDTAFAAARTDHGVDAALLVVAQRHRAETEALDLLDAMRPHRDRVLGVGLGGPELEHPPAKFARFFAEAGRQGYRRTAHAGEEGPPEYVRQALDLCGVERIDHGYTAAADPDLVARLADQAVPLTLCPLSNLRLRVTDDLARYPLRDLTSAGVPVTVNSDDPPYFGGYLADNYRALVDAQDLTDDEVVALARTGFTASFDEPDRIDTALAAIEQRTG